MFNLTKSLCLIITLTSFSYGFAIDKNKYRAYIATRLAKASMYNTPEESVEEMCDGSGWITHGDGHKTQCPGCPACKNDGDPGDAYTDINQYDYYVYHLGATWCGPCQSMIRNTWSNKKMKDFLKENKAKLIILDADNKEHKELFSYYKVSSYPTIILVKSDETQKVLNKTVGYKDADNMVKILDEKI